jgi:hypothetical protein
MSEGVPQNNELFPSEIDARIAAARIGTRHKLNMFCFI